MERKKRTVALTVLLFLLLLLYPMADIFAGDLEKSGSVETYSAEQQALEESDQDDLIVSDPLEPVNRLVFEFNDRLYFWFLKPAASFYSYVMPEDLRMLIDNFFRNSTAPVRIVNNLLQGKLEGAGMELARFGINSTIGLAGLADPAKKDFHLEEKDEDFGQTLGYYGIKHGFYIVWPVIGPLTIRDSIGWIADAFLDPFFYLEDDLIWVGVWGADEINSVSLHIGDYESIKESALDPYISIQDAYIQNRDKEVKR
jgi:phospholipid-binding lipoprotein MlaA